MKEKAEMTREELIALGWMKKPSDKMQEKPKNQLTAVEWLVEQMRQRKEQGLTLSFYDLEMFASYAKEMEHEQMETTWNNAIDAELKDKWQSFDQFHNQTFKSE